MGFFMDYSEHQENFSDKELFVKIWTSPRKVFRYLNERSYNKYVIILLVLGGISNAFGLAAFMYFAAKILMFIFEIIVGILGDEIQLAKTLMFILDIIANKISIWSIISVCLIAGGLFGCVIYYIYALLLNWTGKWLKGEGNTGSILRMLAYSIIPSIIAVVFLIPEVCIYNVMFKSGGDLLTILSGENIGSILIILLNLFSLLKFVLGIWAIVLCIIGISEVQKFSIGKSILNFFMPSLIIFVPIFLLILLLI